MGTSEWFSCENGHPVLAGSTICVKCGGQVTSRRIARPMASTPSPNPSGSSPDVKRRSALILAVFMAISIAAASALFFTVASLEVSQTSTPPVASIVPCEDVDAVEIALGVPYLDAPTVACFTVEEEATITVGARGSEYSDLSIMIERTDGVFWAGADDTHGSDPGVSTIFLPGSYIVTVADFYSSPPDPFTLYSVVGDPDDPWTIISASVPSLAECGSPGVPSLDASASPSAGATRYTCLTIESGGFVKLGAATDEGNLADLNLAVHAFDGSGRPQYIRSVDNAFGFDPEMSIDLDAGTYLIEVGEWTGAPLGGFSLYVDTPGSYFRQGAVSSYLSSLTPSDCTDGTLPALAYGDPWTFTETRALGCVTLDATTRLVVDVTSTANQDLTIEVAGFTEDSLPVRYGWADDNLWATSPEDVDPRLDILLPPGVYVIAASPFGGGAVEGLILTLSTA